MHHFREADVPLLLEDVHSMLEQYPPLTVHQAISGLRRSMRSPASPSSGRLWKLRGGGWMRQEFEDILAKHGYIVHHEGRVARIVLVPHADSGEPAPDFVYAHNGS